MNFATMTVKELRAFAAEEEVDLGDAKSKAEILSLLLNVNAEISEAEEPAVGVITGPEKKSSPNSNVVTNDDDGIFRSAAADRKPVAPEADPKPEPEKAAIYSDRNVRWNGVGEISKGYNIVTREAADKWMTIRGVREATPKEVATYHGI